jgi:peroxin-6
MTPQYYLSEIASHADIAVLVSYTDFEQALDNLVPSVSKSEMEHYAKIQQRFKN